MYARLTFHKGASMPETATADARRITTVESRYPKEIGLKNGRAIQLRLMGASDKSIVLAFARALPANDLLFLRTNITEDSVVDDWIANIARNRTATVLAIDNGAVVGYAALHYEEATWTRHVGEIRLLSGATMRGQGLGRILAFEVFEVARTLGLRKLIAQMTLDQAGARSVFEHLGFKAEALLTDFVISADGRTRDLLMMAYDLDGHSNTVVV